MQAFMWAFKPTNVVDIRYFPRQEQQNIDDNLARLTGKPISDKKVESEEPALRVVNVPTRSGPTL